MYIDSQLNHYFRNVAKALPCSRKNKQPIIAQFRDSVNEYLEANPDADFSTVQDHFGTPQQIAYGFLDGRNVFFLLRKLRITKRIVAIVACATAVALLLWAGAVCWAMAEHHEESHGHIETTVFSDSFQ